MSTYENDIDVRLVSPSDQGYRAWKEWNTRAWRERRSREKVARERIAPDDRARTPASVPPASSVAPVGRDTCATHFEHEREAFSRDAEHLLSIDIARRLPVWGRRILRYGFQKPDGRWLARYRELDIVALDGRRLYIFEVKATKGRKTVLTGIQQLSFVREVLQTSFLDVITTLLVVDTDPENTMPETSVSAFVRTSPDLVCIDDLEALTSAPVIHAITYTAADLGRIAGRPLSTPWVSAA